MNTKLKTQMVVLLAVAAFLLTPSLKTTAQNNDWAASTTKKSSDSAQVNYIAKYKIKSITSLTYSTSDSTLNNAKLTGKNKSVYDRQANLVESTSENWAGKQMNRTESKYDSKNNLIESVYYDSTNRITYTEKRFYDDANRMIKSSSTAPLSLYTLKEEDDNKTRTNTNIMKYDLNGNLLEYSTDSAGVVISRSLSKYDNKNQIVFSEFYDHNNLQSTAKYVYDSKGGYTNTIEYYWTAGRTQCSPNKNRTVTKFDKKDNVISSISTSDQNGAVSTTKTTNEYKYYDEERFLSYKTTTETTAEGFSSKSVNTQTYKYDKNGNEIESVAKYGGSGGGTYTVKTEYNSNNMILKQITYNGTCMDKPQTIASYIYYPDGKSVKEIAYETFDYLSKSLEKYDERTIQTESISLSDYGSTRIVYNYEFW